MTNRLYYADAYRQSFVAQVLDRQEVEGRPAVVLSASAFYPTSGGQPHDTGLLAGIPVVDVRVGPSGEVLHLLAEPLPEGLMQVQGRIDWPRRLDYMQQHSGQHLLSQTFYRELGRETVSVHFGDESSTLDLEGPLLTPGQVAVAEAKANELIWEDRSIRSYWVRDEDLPKTPLRRPPKVQGRIRIVEIDKFDWSACGGTHVRSTGSIGAIGLLRVEKHRGRSRVHFICGRRAQQDAARRRELLTVAAGQLDANVEEVPALVARLQANLRQVDKELRALQDRLRVYQVQELWTQARRAGSARLVVQALPQADPKEMQALASRLTERSGAVVLLGCAPGPKASLLFACSPDVPLHMGELLKETLGQFGGGGGGRPNFAQGGGAPAEQLILALKSAAQTAQSRLADG